MPTAELNAASHEEHTADVEPPQATSTAERPAASVAPPTPASVAPAPVAVAVRAPTPSVATPPPRPPEAAKPVALKAATPPSPAVDPKPPAPRDVTTGTLLCRRYVLGRLLGAGGSSLIFQAEDRRRVGARDFGSRIAIKVLRPEMRNNPHALTRLRREFRQMQRLTHPGIAKVFELGRDEDVWFMTMELIEGQTIHQWLKTNTNRIDGLKVISACCEALHCAHEAGVVHGDLKPSNVLVLPDNAVKLVDFGSAAERDASMGVIDKERSFAATPPYASPQVLAGEVADPRDDVFSLACLTYGVLTHGEHPFERKSSAEAHQAQMRPAYARGISTRQFDVLVRALSWDREQRPATVREFMHALLASDLRRDAPVRDPALATSEVVSTPLPASTVASVSAKPTEPPAAPPRIAAPIRETPIEQPKPISEVKPDDIARLKAAVAAAEAHADRVDKVATHEPKSPKPDPLDRFKGYVAGPLAPQADEDIATSSAAREERTTSEKKKWTWPWQRSALFAALLITGAAIVATQVDFDAEPIPHAAARPAATVIEESPLATSAAVAALPATAAPQVEEKKTPVEVKPKPVAAAPGQVSFETRTLQVGANQTVAALSVKRLNSTRGRARVAWAIEAGTAQPGVHYKVSNPQVIEFLDGQTVRSLFIPLTPDTDAESSRHSKTFTVKLQPAAGGLSLGEIKQVYVTIVGDVAIADESLAAATADVGE